MSPAGSPKCPYCDQEIVASELPFGSVECGECGERVWFLTVSGERAYFKYEAAALVQRLFEGLISGQRVPRELGLDGLDVVEMVKAFEDELEEAL